MTRIDDSVTGTIIFAASPADEASVAQARAFIRLHAITPDEVKLVMREGVVCVIDKGETWRRIKPSMQEV